MSALSKQRESVLFRDNGICQLRKLGITDHRCAGLPQCAHLPSKQSIRLRQKALAIRLRHGGTISGPEQHLLDTPYETVASDPRGALTFCERGHNSFDLLGERGDRTKLPDHVLEFVTEYGLEPALDRLFSWSSERVILRREIWL